MPRPAAKGEPALERYNAKRDFRKTPEPSGSPARARRAAKPLAFVIQKHHASRLHYDFRLEHGGVLWSWAVPKGPSFDPAEKRMAVQTEDHPLGYASFEGTIPAGQYGAGTVIVWDEGTWTPEGDPVAGLEQGKLVFRLQGQKLAGLWELVRISKPGEKQDARILFKKRDEWARPSAEYDVVSALPDSVVAKPLGLLEDRETPPAAAAPRRHAKDVAKLADPPDPPDLRDLPRAALPASLAPQLATLVSSPPAGDWVVETKFDGYRMLARVDDGQARLFTRNGNDWTAKLPALAEALALLPVGAAWLDGEIVVLNDRGVPDFNALQNAMDSTRSDAVVFFLFDAPFLDGHDLRALTVRERRALLQARLQSVPAQARLRFSEAFDTSPAQMLDAACRMGLEGVMLKRPDSPYVSTRSDTWLKLKCILRQEFVICGFTPRTNTISEVGGMMLGYHENGRLRYAGNVGTGWDAKTGRELMRQLQRLEVDQPPFDDPAAVKPGRWSRRAPGTERWVRPKLVCEVAFTEWTPDGHVRHPSFKGLRIDKPAAAITRETAAVTVTGTRRAGLKVTNPERVVDASTGITKLELVRYYESVAEWMLPHLRDRPVSLVRAPSGIEGELFFQKHPETRMPGLTELDPALWPGHTALLAVQDTDALLAAAQMNVVEFHTWNSTVHAIDHPDRMIFDLDPGEGVKWAQLQEAALLLRELLQELALASWLKTSGGKGLHVVVPLDRTLGYEAVKDFSQAVVQHIARVIPQRFVAKSGAANRVGRIFIDYLRNGHGQTTAAAFSARARPGLGVSMPVAWDELSSLKGGAHWSVATARDRLSFLSADPWGGYSQARQSLREGLARLRPARS